MTVRESGRGDRVGLLGYGCMRWPTVDGGNSNQWARNASTAAIDQKQVNELIDYALAHGVNYFDTAPVYCRGESEKVTGIALKRHPREKWRIATKLSNFNAQFHTEEGAKKMYRDSFRILGVDYIDYYLLHSIGGGETEKEAMELFETRFIRNGMLDFLVKEREAGRIRHLGFSFHGQEAVFRHALSLHGKVHWDFVQIQLNYVDWKRAKLVNPRNVNAETLYGLLAEKKIPAVVMEPLLGGGLAQVKESVMKKLAPLDPEATAAKWAMRFAGTHPGVLTVLSGMMRKEHLEENCATYTPLKPLSGEELAALDRAAAAYLSDDHIGCTACNYCMPCPYGLDIPGIFGVWNRAVTEDRLPDLEEARKGKGLVALKRLLIDYERAIPKLRSAERCTGCGRCEGHCPQALKISRLVRKVGDYVEQARRICNG